MLCSVHLFNQMEMELELPKVTWCLSFLGRGLFQNNISFSQLSSYGRWFWEFVEIFFGQILTLICNFWEKQFLARYSHFPIKFIRKLGATNSSLKMCLESPVPPFFPTRITQTLSRKKIKFYLTKTNSNVWSLQNFTFYLPQRRASRVRTFSGLKKFTKIFWRFSVPGLRLVLLRVQPLEVQATANVIQAPAQRSQARGQLGELHN